MNKYILLAFIFYTNIAFSNNLDSTTIFTSSFERQAFKDFNDSLNPEPLRLFSALQYQKGDYENMKSNIDNIYKKLLHSGIKKKKLSKQIKLIYKTVHADLLKKYQENVIFNKILSNGEYNCVTATALYALMLDKFNIPYAIRKKPNHVYLIVSPGDQNILMESTNPKKGVLVYDDKAKKDYVKYLYNNKLISKEEFNYNSSNDLFNKYYNTDDTINIYQLAGIHYYNHGLKLYTEDKFEYSMDEFEKANNLSPKDAVIAYSYSQLIYEIIAKEANNGNYDGEVLAKLVNLNRTNEELIKNAQEILKSIGNELLITNSKFDEYKQFYTDFKNTIIDTLDISEFDDIHSFSLGYYYYMTQDYAKSLHTLHSLYKKHPENLNTKNIIHDDFAKLIYSYKDSKEEDALMDTIQMYFKMYPVLFDYDYFKTIYSLSLFTKMGTAFDNHDADEGHYWLSKIDSVYTINRSFNYDIDFVRPQLWNVYNFYNSYRTNYDSIINIFTRMSNYFPDNYSIERKIADAKRDKKAHGRYGTKHNDIVIHTVTAKKKNTYTKEEYKKKFKKEFPGQWKSSKFRFPNTKAYVKQPFQTINAKTSSVEYIHDGKRIKGEWSLRPGAKYLYFIPYDHSSYIVFKVIKITEDKLEIRLYTNQKPADRILIFEKVK